MRSLLRRNLICFAGTKAEVRFVAGLKTVNVEKNTAAALSKLLQSVASLERRQLLAGFEERVWESVRNFKGNVEGQVNSLSVTDYLKPSIEKAAALTHQIASGQYPHNLKTAKISDYTFDVISNLWRQHCLESEVLSVPFLDQAEINWDVPRPSEWFPQARKMKREIVMHVGPTNSGKTYSSLQEFAKAKSGYYAGPLRLLAREIYETFQAQNISCNLITGEEVVPSLDKFGNVSELSSGTIEMIPLQKKMDMCIIDEIQMIADPSRGAAWTNAVLGVQAKVVHLCGEESAVPLIQELMKDTGDQLTVKRYLRLGRLTTEGKLVNNFRNLKKGDCVVAFSKRMILELKCRIESASKLKVGVIYGALPPEIRSQEASRFNRGEYDVLVASDAIGMGLNLKICRVVFWTTQKFNGVDKDYLSVSATRQIGGRAGRFSVQEGEMEGFVTSFHQRDLTFLRKKMKESIPNVKRACIWPPNQFWVQYVSSFRKPKSLKAAVSTFYLSLESTKMKNYFLSESEHLHVIDLMSKRKLDLQLTIEDQLRLSQVPINLRGADPEVVENTVRLFQAITKTESKTVFDLGILDMDILRDTPSRLNHPDEILGILTRLEQNHKLVLLFMWLSQRWPTIFIDKESAGEIKTMIEKRISEELDCLRSVVNKKRD